MTKILKKIENPVSKAKTTLKVFEYTKRHAEYDSRLKKGLS